MDLRKIRTLLQLMNENDLAEMELEEDGMKIKFSKGMITTVPASPAMIAAPGAVAPAAPAPAVATEAPVEEEGHVITSPMPGTFYTAPSPDQPAFVKVGDTVDPDTVICIVEAMKVMNEIKAECSGKVVEMYVQNADPVEFGKPLFRVV